MQKAMMLTVEEPTYVPVTDISGYVHAKTTRNDACEVFVTVTVPSEVFEMVDKPAIGAGLGDLKVIIAGNTCFLIDREKEAAACTG